MALALDKFVGSAAAPDRLTDPTERFTGHPVPVYEIAPGRDDAGRVGADFRHVREKHLVRVALQSSSQRFDLLRRLHHQHRLAGRHALTNEGDRSIDELSRSRIEERLVAEAVDSRR